MGEKIGTVVLKGYAQKHECLYEDKIAICIENNTKFQSAQLVLMMYQLITTKHKVIWDPPMYKYKLKILICHPLHLDLKVKPFQINFYIM